MKTRVRTIVSVFLVLAFAAAIPLSVSAKPGNVKSTEVKVDTKVKDDTKDKMPKAKDKDESIKDVTTEKAENGKSNSDVKDNKDSKDSKDSKDNMDNMDNMDNKESTPKTKPEPPEIADILSEHFTSIDRKLTSVQNEVYRIIAEIDTFLEVRIGDAPIETNIMTGTAGTGGTDSNTGTTANTDTTVNTGTSGAPDTTTDSAGTTTNIPVNDVTKNRDSYVKDINGFVNGTAGRLNALSNRLSSIGNSLRAVESKADILTNEKYIDLVKEFTDRMDALKTEISKQLDRLHGISLTGGALIWMYIWR